MTPVKKPELPEAEKPIIVGRSVNPIKALVSGAVKRITNEPDPERAERVSEARRESERAGFDWVEGKDWEDSQREPSVPGKASKYPNVGTNSELPDLSLLVRLIVAIVILVVLLGVFRLI